MNVNKVNECLYRSFWKKIKEDTFSCYVCGWAQYQDIVLDTQGILDVLIQSNLTNSNDFKQFVSDLNGSFTIIFSDHLRTSIAADRMRTYPVVYFFTDEKLVITDNIDEYRKNNSENLSIDEVVAEQYLCSDFVFGPYTIFKNVFSIQSGEIVTVDHASKSFEREQYFQWIPNMNDDLYERNLEIEAKQQDIIFTSVFKRMIKSAPLVHNWIIPLSGGYDSRTIANYLYKLGVKNVICFSYGMRDNLQSKISQQVSEAFGYKWYFIDYSEWISKIQTNLIDTYLEYAFNGSSAAHLQDFPAVYALKEMGIIHKNDIFVPGHTLDFITGNHLKLQMQSCNTVKSVLPLIQRHFKGFGYYTKKRSKVYSHAKSIISKYGIATTEMAESFNWQERQAKFIVNSVKAYEFFGFGWRIPGWDEELMNYWDKIGFNYRYERNMFKDIFKKYLAVDELKSIPFVNDLIVHRKKSLKTSLLNSLPLWIKKLLKKSGLKTSFYYVGEGSHLIYSNHTETISEYLKSYSVPLSIKKYLKQYLQKQKLSGFAINSVSTLLIIRKSYK